MNKEKKYLSREHLNIMVCVTLILVLVLGATITVRKTKAVTDSLSQEVIRFHVVANSDTTEDQLLKQHVRDEVIEFMEPIIKECHSVENTKYAIQGALPTIKQIAEDVVKEYGKSYPIYVALDKANFPTKAYGDIILPSGEYEACRIVIGEGKGENWWCVMYPPLCYLDAASGVVPLEGKEQLEQQLSNDEYNLVANQQHGKYKIRFKIVDTVNAFFMKPNYKSKNVKAS